MASPKDLNGINHQPKPKKDQGQKWKQKEDTQELNMSNLRIGFHKELLFDIYRQTEWKFVN